MLRKLPSARTGRGLYRSLRSTNQSISLSRTRQTRVFEDAVASIGVALVVQVVAFGTCGDFGDQVGGAGDVAFLIDPDPPAALGWMNSRQSGCGMLLRPRRTVLLSLSSTPGVRARYAKSQPIKVECGAP